MHAAGQPEVDYPRTPETTGMHGEAQFRAMKPSAHYICFSRGGIADGHLALGHNVLVAFTSWRLISN